MSDLKKYLKDKYAQEVQPTIPADAWDKFAIKADLPKEEKRDRKFIILFYSLILLFSVVAVKSWGYLSQEQSVQTAVIENTEDSSTPLIFETAAEINPAIVSDEEILTEGNRLRERDPSSLIENPSSGQGSTKTNTFVSKQKKAPAITPFSNANFYKEPFIPSRLKSNSSEKNIGPIPEDVKSEKVIVNIEDNQNENEESLDPLYFAGYGILEASEIVFDFPSETIFGDEDIIASAILPWSITIAAGTGSYVHLSVPYYENFVLELGLSKDISKHFLLTSSLKWQQLYYQSRVQNLEIGLRSATLPTRTSTLDRIDSKISRIEMGLGFAYKSNAWKGFHFSGGPQLVFIQDLAASRTDVFLDIDETINPSYDTEVAKSNYPLNLNLGVSLHYKWTKSLFVTLHIEQLKQLKKNDLVLPSQNRIMVGVTKLF